MGAVAIAGVGADDVVIGDDVNGPVACGVHGGNVFAILIRGEALEAGHHQIHRHLQLVIFGAVVILQLDNVAGPRFANEHGTVFVGSAAQLAHHVVNFGQFFVVGLLHVVTSKFIGALEHRIVGKGGIFK